MKSALTKRPLPLPADVREQLVEIHARQQREFTETTYIPVPDKHEWLLQMIERGHR